MALHEMMKVLQRAQDTYGYKNQVSVAAEELCELATVCNKYVRFPDHNTACESIREKILEETADVVIVLHHLYMIFNITPEEQQRYMDAKLDRLVRWMDESPDLYQSTLDREIKVNGVKTGRMYCSEPNATCEVRVSPSKPKPKKSCSNCAYTDVQGDDCIHCSYCIGHINWTPIGGVSP